MKRKEAGMKWKRLSRDEGAVAAVIGTILMVGITVVLAAILYMWASSFLEHTENEPPDFQKDNPRNATVSSGPSESSVEVAAVLIGPEEPGIAVRKQ